MTENCIFNYKKNLNATFSYIYFYIKNVLPKTQTLLLQCDNCPGTNKNNYLFQFIHFLVHKEKLFKEVIINFMIPGHTKFSIDGSFGNLKTSLN